VTDQLLLPIGAGFRDWKLYPSRPDLKRANRNARGALRGKKATLIVDSTGSGRALGDVIKSNLTPLGLQVEVVPIAPTVLRDYLRTSRSGTSPLCTRTRARRSNRSSMWAEGDRYDPSQRDVPLLQLQRSTTRRVRCMRRTDNLRHGRLAAAAFLDRT
jgi:hypothetical protein